jgi:hypothetical protein
MVTVSDPGRRGDAPKERDVMGVTEQQSHCVIATRSGA